MDNMLLENYLASQFKFGFELEAFKTEGSLDFNASPSHWDDDQPYEEDEDSEEESHWDDDQPYEDDSEESIIEYIRDDISKAFNFKTSEIGIKYDGSLRPSDVDDYAFEWATPVMDFTPANIKRSIKGLDTLMRHGEYYTNNTCGFHVHLSFPDISDADCIWIISKLSLDEDMLYTLADGVANCEFYSDDWAEMDFLKELGESLKDGNYEGIAPVFTTEKYRMLHIHPQGTIEWRGPRGFMNSEYNIKNVYEFFKLLHKFVMWIGHTLAEFEILGMSRDNYFKLIFNEDYKENELISDFNKKKKEQASIRRLSKMFKDGDSSNLINLIKKSYNKNERNYENYNKCNLIFWLLENNIEKYSKFIKDLFLRTVALKDNKLREEVLKMLSYYGDIFTKGFLTLSFDEMVYCFLMLLNNVNNNSCLYNILTYNLNNETVNEAFNKALRNCTSQKINGETLKQLFYNFDGLEKYGKSINTPDVIDVETLEAQLFSSISNVASTKKEGSSNLFKEEDFKNNDIFHHFIKICLAAHENEVLASILNNLLNKMGIYFGSQNNNIKLKEMEKYCKYLQHIILTGNTNYEFNV